MALRPLLAIVGPWNQGYELKQDNFHEKIQVSETDGGLQFVSVPHPNNLSAPASHVIIQELPINESELLALLAVTPDAAAN